MKRKNAHAFLALVAALFSTFACGGDGGTSPSDASSPEGGGAGAGGWNVGSGTAGAGFGGFGGFVFPDGGPNHDCPTERPPDSSACSGRSTCHYPDGVCNCIRADGNDASGREWNCFDTPPRDGGSCPKSPPQEGDICMTAGDKCPFLDPTRLCSCVAVDGNLQWHC